MPGNPADRYGGRSSRHVKNQFSDTVHLTNDRPPTYTSGHYGDVGSRFSRAAPPDTSAFYGKEGGSSLTRNPKNWSRRCWIILAGALVIVLIIVIVIAVVVSRANQYPDYSTLNYSLVDTYSGASFFDYFDYFTGYDPAQGFVQYVCHPSGRVPILTHSTSVMSTAQAPLLLTSHMPQRPRRSCVWISQIRTRRLAASR